MSQDDHAADAFAYALAAFRASGIAGQVGLGNAGAKSGNAGSENPFSSNLFHDVQDAQFRHYRTNPASHWQADILLTSAYRAVSGEVKVAISAAQLRDARRRKAPTTALEARLGRRIAAATLAKEVEPSRPWC